MSTQDEVVLRVAGWEIKNLQAYSIEAGLYTAADAFSLEIPLPEVPFAEGSRCELWVNGHLELDGIIDAIDESYSKAGYALRAEGRDLCGLLVDSCCEEYFDVQGYTCKALAERLIRTVPYIRRSDIEYQQNIRGNLKKKKGRASAVASMDSSQDFARIEPGQTVFEVLKTFAASRGLLFYYLPEGTFVFGKPLDSGEPLFHIVNRKGRPKENNVIEGRRRKDLSQRFSKITIVGQQQGTDSTEASAINTMAAVTDTTFPFYKPYVTTDNNDARAPKLHAQMLMEKQRAEGLTLEYTVQGHNQDGRNWAINRICHVTDETLKIEADYLIYGRTFERSKDHGTVTRLRLGPPGVVQA